MMPPMLKTLKLTSCRTHIFYYNSSLLFQKIICKELETLKRYHFKACGGSAICLSLLVVYLSSVSVYYFHFSEYVTLSTNTFDLMCFGIIVSKFSIRLLSQWFPFKEMDLPKGRIAWAGGSSIPSAPHPVWLLPRAGQDSWEWVPWHLRRCILYCSSGKTEDTDTPRWGGRFSESFAASVLVCGWVWFYFKLNFKTLQINSSYNPDLVLLFDYHKI